jgi:LysM repeat protein
MGMKRLLIALVVVLALMLAACTRPASPSNPEAGSQAEGEGSELPFPTSEFNPMDILETAAAATLTAQVPGESEQVVEPTATEPPVVEEQPAATATPMAEPTAVPEPTEEPSPEAPAQPEVSACASPYTVSEGEWVWNIARKCGLDPDQVIAINGLVFPYTLYPGDTLQLPEATGFPGGSTDGSTGSTGNTCGGSYTVQLGDWVSSIASACNSTTEAIVQANNLAFPYTIFPGDVLVIP